MERDAADYQAASLRAPHERLRLLVTVKTYPTPSARYQETVCTAGISSDGRWIRLYPVPFRYWDEEQQYELYDWIELDARRPSDDTRKESYRPVGDITVLSHVPPDNHWEQRKQLVLPHASPSVEYLTDAYERDGTSLGLVQPGEVTDVIVEKESADWTPRERAILTQGRLFGSQPKPLEKLDHRFSYRFRCHGTDCKTHEMMITDWGLCYLYLKMRRECGTEEAVQKTLAKCRDVVARDKDAWFYVGTVYPYRTFIIVGMFYPKKLPEGEQGAFSFD